MFLFVVVTPAFAQLKKIRFSTTSIAVGGMNYLDDAWMRGAIEFTKKSLGVTKEIAPSQVFDFSFVEKAWSDIKN